MISWWWIPLTIAGCAVAGASWLAWWLKDMFRW